MAGLLNHNYQQATPADSTDDLLAAPSARFPGKAMMLSLAVPGAGQLYSGRKLRAAGFITVEVAAFWLWNTKNTQGFDQIDKYEDYANEHWDFLRWLTTAEDFTIELGWDDIKDMGTAGTHSLEYYVDIDADANGIPDIFGDTKNDAQELLEYVGIDSMRTRLNVKKNHEYYENIGKYNQFFSGWEDSDPDNPDIRETKSGPLAWSDKRDEYLTMREKANSLRATATYAISAIMFNHVLSAVDALFTAAAANRQKQGTQIGGRLMYNPKSASGIGGIQLTYSW